MPQVIAARTAQFTPQPAHAYMNLYIGDKIFSTEPPKPCILQGFEMTRIQEQSSTAYFTLFDDDWYKLEKYLADNYNNIYLEYGYSGGVKSRKYKLRLKNYSISFVFTGVILSVEATTEGAIDNLKSITLETAESNANSSYNPTEAIRNICEAAGFTIDESKFVDTEDVIRDEPYNLIQENPITYIQQVIIPEAQKDNEILLFNVDDKNVATFTRMVYGEEREATHTYIYQKGYDSVVRDLSFDIKGVFGATTRFSLSTKLISSAFDPLTKDEFHASFDTANTVTEAPGTLQHTKASQSDPLIDIAGAAPQQTKNRLYYYVKRDGINMYEANMTIIGDPNIELFESVRIIVVTDDGFLHHTSGRYMIKGITDTLSGGQLTTTLKLIRNGDIEEGIEIIHPKKIVK